MEQIIVKTKVKVEHKASLILQCIPLVLYLASLLSFRDKENMIYPVIICSFSISILFSLSKHSIKSLTFNSQGVTIHRYLLRDLYLPYDKLTHVWNYTFFFRGFELATEMFYEQVEIIAAFNVFRTRGLIKAPERKANLWEIVEQWAAPVVLIVSSLVVITVDFVAIGTGSGGLTETMVFSVVIVSVAAFLAQTIYRFLLRREKTPTL